MPMNRQLFRCRDDRMLAGVACGLAELWNMDPTLVRIIWALLVPFTGGFALLVYVVMAIVVPEEDEEPIAYAQSAPASSTPRGPSASAGGAGPGEPLVPPIPPPPVVPPPAVLPPPPLDWRDARREARAGRRAARRAHRSGPGNGGLLIGALLVIAGVYFLVREYIPDIDVNWIWPGALIVLGVFVLMSAFRRPPDDTTRPDAP
jgi:phage shock protein C